MFRVSESDIFMIRVNILIFIFFDRFFFLHRRANKSAS